MAGLPLYSACDFVRPPWSVSAASRVERCKSWGPETIALPAVILRVSNLAIQVRWLVSELSGEFSYGQEPGASARRLILLKREH